MLKNEADDRSITIRILRSLYEEVSRIVARRNVYSNEADFIRDAIREKLEREMGGRKN
jgi:Arc/MetJ-type ribon-helix-helix transcriptional regulator